MLRCNVDHSVFYRHVEDGIIVILVSVDDLTILASTLSLIEYVKMALRSVFEITDLGDVHWLLASRSHATERTVPFPSPNVPTSSPSRRSLAKWVLNQQRAQWIRILDSRKPNAHKTLVKRSPWQLYPIEVQLAERCMRAPVLVPISPSHCMNSLDSSLTRVCPIGPQPYELFGTSTRRRIGC